MQVPFSSSRSFSDFLRDKPALATVALVLISLMLGIGAGAAVSFGPFWLGFAALFALLAGLALLRSVDLGLLAVFGAALLLPFGALPFTLAVTPTFLELALIALLGVTTLRVLAVPELDVRMSALGGPLLGWIGLTVFALVLGAGGLPDNLTLHNYVKFILGVLLFFAVLNIVRTREQMRFTMRWLVLGGAAAALIGLGLYALNDATALRLLTALGRFGYPTSGRVLRYVPDDPDGVWPSRVVRDLVERIESPDLEKGLVLGLRNSRGVTSRGLTDGGEQERALQARYLTYAEQVGGRWPRTAALLRRIARGYADEARRHDAEAEITENGWI